MRIVHTVGDSVFYHVANLLRQRDYFMIVGLGYAVYAAHLHFHGKSDR